jgi:hypothetical protein
VKLIQGIRDIRCAVSVQKEIKDQAYCLCFLFIDPKHLLVPAVAIRHFHLVVPQQGRGQESSTAEPPFKGKQHGFTLHMAFFFRDHGQNKEDDVACGV